MRHAVKFTRPSLDSAATLALSTLVASNPATAQDDNTQGQQGDNATQLRDLVSDTRVSRSAHSGE